MITADKAIELLKDYSRAMEDEDEKKCRTYCEKLYSQKQANNLKMVYEYDEDKPLDFFYYLNELIDLLNHEEAVKLHVEIAKELIQNSYKKNYQYDFSYWVGLHDFLSLIKLWKLTFDKCKEIYIDKNGNKILEMLHEDHYSVSDIICISMLVTGVFERMLINSCWHDDLGDCLISEILWQYNWHEYDVYYYTVDISGYVKNLTSQKGLEEIILAGLQSDYYDFDLLKTALDNSCSSSKILCFIFDISNGNDLNEYECYFSYSDTIDELVESLTDLQRSELLLGIVKHPNVTEEILEQLTDLEEQKVAESAREKLQEM